MQKLTQEQALVITGYTGILACKFSDFHADCVKRLGRPIFTHEFANPKVKEEIENSYRPDFMEMISK
jgi:hypothetical protein